MVYLDNPPRVPAKIVTEEYLFMIRPDSQGHNFVSKSINGLISPTVNDLNRLVSPEIISPYKRKLMASGADYRVEIRYDPTKNKNSFLCVVVTTKNGNGHNELLSINTGIKAFHQLSLDLSPLSFIEKTRSSFSKEESNGKSSWIDVSEIDISGNGITQDI